MAALPRHSETSSPPNVDAPAFDQLEEPVRTRTPFIVVAIALGATIAAIVWRGRRRKKTKKTMPTSAVEAAERIAATIGKDVVALGKEMSGLPVSAGRALVHLAHSD